MQGAPVAALGICLDLHSFAHVPLTQVAVSRPPVQKVTGPTIVRRWRSGVSGKRGEANERSPGRRAGRDLYMPPAGLAPALVLALMQAHAVHALSGAARGTGCTPPPRQRAAAARPPGCMCIRAPGCWTQMQSAALHHMYENAPSPNGLPASMQPGRGGMRTPEAPSCTRRHTHFLSA
jgi:hypothetical protein